MAEGAGFTGGRSTLMLTLIIAKAAALAYATIRSLAELPDLLAAV